MFNHGIMVDYNSTDNSVEIIKELCPTWEIIKTRNESFDAALVDKEIEDIETQIKGWRICLNTTEFIIGDLDLLYITDYDDIYVKQIPMVDSVECEFTELNPNKDLIKQRFYGINLLYDIRFSSDPYLVFDRRSRLLSNHPNKYTPGRHFPEITTINKRVPFLILWYGFSPFNDRLLNRKLQIQNKMPKSDIDKGLGLQHITSGQKIINAFKSIYQPMSKDLRPFIKDYYNFESV